MAAVRQILSIPSENLELIVRDTGESNALEERIRELEDSRFVYKHGPPVSALENWNLAAEMAKGEYVCFIGDDDGVNPAIVSFVEWASRAGADALVSPYSAVYYWPDFPNRQYAGRLFLGKCSGEIRLLPAKRELIRYIDSARNPVRLLRIYHGTVRRDCLEEIRRRTGQYFHTPAFDDYISYMLCTLIDSYYFVDIPLTIAGKCKSSDSGLYAVSGNAREILSFYRDEEKVLDRRAPPTAKVESLKIDALVKALQHGEARELIGTIVDGQRYASWYALSLRGSGSDAFLSIRHLWTSALQDRNFLGKIRIVVCVFVALAGHAFRKMRRMFIELLGGYGLMISGSDQQSVYAAGDIYEAASIVEQQVREQVNGSIGAVIRRKPHTVS